MNDGAYHVADKSLVAQMHYGDTVPRCLGWEGQYPACKYSDKSLCEEPCVKCHAIMEDCDILYHTAFLTKK